MKSHGNAEITEASRQARLKATFRPSVGNLAAKALAAAEQRIAKQLHDGKGSPSFHPFPSKNIAQLVAGSPANVQQTDGRAV